MEWDELHTYLSQKFDDAKNKNLAFSQMCNKERTMHFTFVGFFANPHTTP